MSYVVLCLIFYRFYYSKNPKPRDAILTHHSDVSCLHGLPSHPEEPGPVFPSPFPRSPLRYAGSLSQLFPLNLPLHMCQLLVLVVSIGGGGGGVNLQYLHGRNNALLARNKSI